jgi:predicted oxidoreductase
MEKVYLSENGPEISQIIYSFWRAEEEEAQLTAKAVEEKVHKCLELGVNTFDHADHYGHYRIESLFGKVLQEKSIRREDVVISTKCGLTGFDGKDGATPYYDNTGENIRRSAESSLKNLKTDYIDIFLLEQFDPLADPD